MTINYTNWGDTWHILFPQSSGASSGQVNGQIRHGTTFKYSGEVDLKAEPNSHALHIYPTYYYTATNAGWYPASSFTLQKYDYGLNLLSSEPVLTPPSAPDILKGLFVDENNNAIYAIYGLFWDTVEDRTNTIVKHNITSGAVQTSAIFEPIYSIFCDGSYLYALTESQQVLKLDKDDLWVVNQIDIDERSSNIYKSNFIQQQNRWYIQSFIYAGQNANNNTCVDNHIAVWDVNSNGFPETQYSTTKISQTVYGGNRGVTSALHYSSNYKVFNRYQTATPTTTTTTSTATTPTTTTTTTTDSTISTGDSVSGPTTIATTTDPTTTTTTTTLPVPSARVPELESVDTMVVTSTIENIGTDSSDSKGTLKTINSMALSFGPLAPGETSPTSIIYLKVPQAVALNNIKLALIDSGGLTFENTTFGVEIQPFIDYNIIPSEEFSGVNETKDVDSLYNVSVSSRDLQNSNYVYLNVSIPIGELFGTGTVRYKWFFDYT